MVTGSPFIPVLSMSVDQSRQNDTCVFSINIAGVCRIVILILQRAVWLDGWTVILSRGD